VRELTRRYVVMRLATDAPFDPADRNAAFVLKPWKDPAALEALVAYRRVCYPELGRDLQAWIEMIGAGPADRGDVGARNEAHAKAARARAVRRPGRRGGPAGTTRRPAKPPARRPGKSTRRGQGRR
jgi:hypothetical protein